MSTAISFLTHHRPGESGLPLLADSATPIGRSLTFSPDIAVSHRRTKSKDRLGKVALPTMDGMCFEKIKRIAYLEAGGNYTVLHFTDGRQVLVCKTLGDMEQLLPSHDFVRIHRSHTVHLRHLKKYVRGKGGHVVLQNGATLVVSAGQRDAFLEALKNYF